MKKLVLLMSVAAVMLMLVGCGSCKHDWVEATCSEPKHCSKCGKTEGFALRHKWKEASCTEPKTCELCGVTEGNPKGHVWKERTMTEPKTCTECGATEGEKITFKEIELGYIFDDPEVASFVCLEHNILYRYKDSDVVDFYDYDRKKVATVTWDQIRTIAEGKMPDLNCFTLASAMRMVAGTARSMGITVTGEFPENL